MFGLMIQTMMTPVMVKAIPALYGQSGAAAGWVAHLFHSVVFGLVFVGLVEATPLARYADRLSTGVALGVGYGVLVWIVAAAVVMPLWLSAVGFPQAPAVPNVNPQSLVGHAVYGLVLGGGFVLAHGR